MSICAVPSLELDETVRNILPWLVICSALSEVIEERAHAWILLHPEGSTHTTVSVAGERWLIPHPTIDELLDIIDNARESLPLDEQSA